LAEHLHGIPAPLVGTGFFDPAGIRAGSLSGPNDNVNGSAENQMNSKPALGGFYFY